MLEEFSKSTYWEHREVLCQPVSLEKGSHIYESGTPADQLTPLRQVVDAYLIFCLNKFFKINSYCEIGVHKGSSLSLILDTNPDCECLVIDPFPRLDFLSSKTDMSKVKLAEVKSQEHYIPPQKKFDFILIDGDHHAPTPKLDVIKMLKHCHQNTIIFLDDIFWPGVSDARKELRNAGWRVWINASNGEIWANQRNLQPFIDHLLSDKSFKRFCVLYRDRINHNQEILVCNMPGGFLNKINCINEIITDEIKNRSK